MHNERNVGSKARESIIVRSEIKRDLHIGVPSLPLVVIVGKESGQLITNITLGQPGKNNRVVVQEVRVADLGDEGACHRPTLRIGRIIDMQDTLSRIERMDADLA